MAVSALTSRPLRSVLLVENKLIFRVKSLDADTGMRLAKTNVDVDLGVLGIGGALIVDLVVGFEGSGAA